MAKFINGANGTFSGKVGSVIGASWRGIHYLHGLAKKSKVPPTEAQVARRAAMIYSFFAICKKHDVNPFHWLKHTLQNIMTINHKNLKDLYPQNYKKNNKNQICSS